MSVMDKIREGSKKQRTAEFRKPLDESEDTENMLVQTYSDEDVEDLEALKEAAEEVGGYVKEVQDEDGETEYEVSVPHLEAQNFESIAESKGAFTSEDDTEDNTLEEKAKSKSKKRKAKFNEEGEDDVLKDDIGDEEEETETLEEGLISKRKAAQKVDEDLDDVSVALVVAKVPNDIVVGNLEKKWNVTVEVRKQRGGIAEVILTAENERYLEKACFELASKIELLDAYNMHDFWEENEIVDKLRAKYHFDEEEEDDTEEDDLEDTDEAERKASLHPKRKPADKSKFKGKSSKKKRKAKFNEEEDTDEYLGEDDTDDELEEEDGLEELRKQNVFTRIANRPVDEAEYTKDEYQAMADELRRIADDLEDGDFDDATRLQAIRDLMPNVGKLRAGITTNESTYAESATEVGENEIDLIPREELFKKVEKFVDNLVMHGDYDGLSYRVDRKTGTITFNYDDDFLIKKFVKDVQKIDELCEIVGLPSQGKLKPSKKTIGNKKKMGGYAKSAFSDEEETDIDEDGEFPDYLNIKTVKSASVKKFLENLKGEYDSDFSVEASKKTGFTLHYNSKDMDTWEIVDALKEVDPKAIISGNHYDKIKNIKRGVEVKNNRTYY